jgi:hypothetical protein
MMLYWTEQMWAAYLTVSILITAIWIGKEA